MLKFEERRGINLMERGICGAVESKIVKKKIQRGVHASLRSHFDMLWGLKKNGSRNGKSELQSNRQRTNASNSGKNAQMKFRDMREFNFRIEIITHFKSVWCFFFHSDFRWHEIRSYSNDKNNTNNSGRRRRRFLNFPSNWSDSGIFRFYWIYVCAFVLFEKFHFRSSPLRASIHARGK